MPHRRPGISISHRAYRIKLCTTLKMRALEDNEAPGIPRCLFSSYTSQASEPGADLHLSRKLKRSLLDKLEYCAAPRVVSVGLNA